MKRLFNFSWKLTGLLIGGGLYFAVNLMIMRYLGPTAYGQWAYVLGLSGLFMILVDYGFNPLIVRDVSQNLNLAPAYFRQISRLKFQFFLIATLCLVLTVLAIHRSSLPITIMLWAAVLWGATSLVDMGQAFTHASEHFRTGAFLGVAHKAAMCIMAVTAMILGATLLPLMRSLALGAFVGALITYLYFYQHFFKTSSPARSEIKTRYLLREGLPLLVQNLFIIVYFRVDTLLLAWMANDRQTGLYNAAYRFFELSNVLPTALLAASVSFISRQVEKEDWTRLLAQQLRPFLGLACMGGLILYGISWMMPGWLLNREFAGSVPILRLLAWTLLFYYPNFLLTTFLVLIKRQVTNAYIAGLCVVINIAGNWYAIPRWGGMGAAFMTLATEASITVLSLAAIIFYQQQRAGSSTQ